MGFAKFLYSRFSFSFLFGLVYLLVAFLLFVLLSFGKITIFFIENCFFIINVIYVCIATLLHDLSKLPVLGWLFGGLNWLVKAPADWLAKSIGEDVGAIVYYFVIGLVTFLLIGGLIDFVKKRWNMKGTSYQQRGQEG